jgi:hypothetical protein
VEEEVVTVLKLEYRDPYIYYLVESKAEAREILDRAARYGANVCVEVQEPESGEDPQC